MRDKYGVKNDLYCYPNIHVLKNKLGIKDRDLLEEVERKISSLSSRQIGFIKPPYNLAYLCSLHAQLFGELYEWAGELRRIDITKGQTRFCNVNFITKQINTLFDALARDEYLLGLEYDAFIEKFAEYYCEFNMIHPFREGNGRVQRLFFEHLAINAEYRISFESVSTEEWIEANIRGVYCDYSKMRQIMSLCISR